MNRLTGKVGVVTVIITGSDLVLENVLILGKF